ncbi:MAG: ABC transporter ATP-binding protein, partial [Pseudomonas fluorescens]
MIQIENLNKQFGSITAVEDVSFNVEEGQICVLLGPSGCGKTTTLKMINRLITPTSGTIRIGGRDTSELDSVTLKRSIGYVIQQVGLFPNMTVEENICVVPNLLGWDKTKSRKRAAELLEVVALDPSKFLKRYPCELSGGQQQRVGVARALAADPPVMLMDEPFGAIDPINREVIQDEFMRIQRLVNKTVLFVSHDIDEAVKMADCVALFHNGKIQQFGSSDDLLARPNSEFVANFMGGDRIMKRLRLLRAADVASKVPPREHMQIVGGNSGVSHSHLIVKPGDDLRQVLSQLLGRGQDWA